MQINYRSFPHPVLSYFSDDYVGCAYQANVRLTVNANEFIVVVKNALSSEGLASLINTTSAAFCFHLECRSTRYRRLFKSHDSDFKVAIPANMLDGTVEACCFVLAEKDIPAYQNDEFHSDFNGHQFNIKKGDFLAVADDREFEAEKAEDPLKRIPSIFLVRLNMQDEAKPMELETTGHKIVVLLSKENHIAYLYLRQAQELQTVLSSMIVIPALIEVINDLKKDSAAAEIEYADLRWYKVLRRRLADVGYKIGAPEFSNEISVVMAHKVIDDPLSQGLTSLVEIVGEE